MLNKLNDIIFLKKGLPFFYKLLGVTIWLQLILWLLQIILRLILVFIPK